MGIYTCITDVRESIEISQCEAISAEVALRSHIGALPYDDGADPFDDEFVWLQAVASGESPIELVPVKNCKGTWFWQDGAHYKPAYITYIVKTDAGSCE